MDRLPAERPTNLQLIEQRCQEQFGGDNSERGFVQAQALFAGALLVMSAVGAGVAGFGEYSIKHPAVQSKVEVTAGKGTLTAVKVIVPESCYGVYQNDVNGAVAKYSKTFNIGALKIPTSFSASSTFNGNLTSKVCNDSMSLDMHFDKPTNKYNVDVPGSAFHTDVSRTNLAVNAFTPDNGFLMAKLKDFENDLNSFGKISTHQADGMMGTLNGLSELAAGQTSAEACGPKAWVYLEPMYKQALQKQFVAEAGRWAPQLGLTEKDFNITIDGAMTFSNQYKDQLKNAKAKADKLGVTFSAPAPNTLVCSPSKDLDKQLAKVSGAAQ